MALSPMHNNDALQEGHEGFQIQLHKAIATVKYIPLTCGGDLIGHKWQSKFSDTRRAIRSNTECD